MDLNHGAQCNEEERTVGLANAVLGVQPPGDDREGGLKEGGCRREMLSEGSTSYQYLCDEKAWCLSRFVACSSVAAAFAVVLSSTEQRQSATDKGRV